MAESSTAPLTLSTGTLAAWFATPLGRYLLEREQAYFDRTLSDIFGYHALQIGLPEYPLLRGSRITTRLTVDLEEPAQVLADPHWLPFAENGVDLIILPHVLEFTDQPHQLLREVHRVIRPEGQLIIAGFNPFVLSASSGISAASRRCPGPATSSRSTGLRIGFRCSASRSRAAVSTATCHPSRRKSGSSGSIS